MRIITGKYGGHEFSEMHKHRTRPMGEKIRGALFNVLGDIEGLTILDAFAGSGAISMEAASRGASEVIAIEKDRAAHNLIDENVRKVGASEVKVVRANAGGWSIHNAERRYDVVVLDPPFTDLQEPLLQRLARRHVKAGGILVLSFPAKTDPPEFPGFSEQVRKDYGDAQLVFYRKTQ